MTILERNKNSVKWTLFSSIQLEYASKYFKKMKAAIIDLISIALH